MTAPARYQVRGRRAARDLKASRSSGEVACYVRAAVFVTLVQHGASGKIRSWVAIMSVMTSWIACVAQVNIST